MLISCMLSPSRSTFSSTRISRSSIRRRMANIRFSGPSALALLRRDQRGALNVGLAGAVVGDALLHLVAEVAEQALDRPGGRVAQGADGVAFDLGGDVQ